MMKRLRPFIRLAKKFRDCSRFRRVRAFNKGATSVEFALIIVPFLALLFGTLQSLLVSTAKLTLDSALQTLAYDAANASATDLQALLNRQNLCTKSVLFLVSCKASSDLCFSVIPLDLGGSIQEPVRTCQAKTAQENPSGCCYQIMVEYQIPVVFDFTRQLMFMSGNMAEPNILRSVAFVYRS